MTKHEQRMDALKGANAIRGEAADIRRELKPMKLRDAKERLAGLIEQGNAAILSRPTGQVLLMVPRIGSAKADHIMAAAGVRVPRKLRELSERQRAVIVDQLRNGGGR